MQTAPAEAARHGFVIHVPGANHASLLGERHASHIAHAIVSVEAAAKGQRARKGLGPDKDLAHKAGE
jgi:hypothetical protein